MVKAFRAVLACAIAVAMGTAFAPSAQAYDVGGFCVTGFVTLPGGACVDLLDGTARGGGSVTAAAPVNKPGGVLAAANGTGGTVAKNAARAGAAGLARGVSLAGRVGQVGAVLAAFEAGYWLGDNVVAPLLCGGLSDWFCRPDTSVDPGFVPNVDVDLSLDGWYGGVNVLTGERTDVLDFRGWCSWGDAVAAPVVFRAPAGLPNAGTTYSGPLMDIGEGCQRVSQSGSGSIEFYGSSGAWQAGLTLVGSPVAHMVASQTGRPLPYFAVAAWGFTGCSNLQMTTFMSCVSSAGGHYIQYAYPGVTGRPEVPADPLRTLATSIVCSSPSGPDVTVTAQSAAFRETDSSWPQIVVPHCPDGSVPAEVGVDVTADGLDSKRLWETEVPGEVQDWQLAFPECVGGGCTLRLYRIGGSDLGDCFQAAGRCSGWFADPDRDVNYECRYGLPGAMVALDLEDCYVYSPTFDVVEQGKGIPYGDPGSGEIPDSITGSDPGAGADGDGGACWPSGWGLFNPLEWVYRPVKCALVELFVPDAEALEGAIAPFRNGYEASSVKAWLDAATSSVSGVSGEGLGACSAWSVDYPLATGGDESLTVLDPCTGPVATVAGVSRVVSSVVLVVLGAWAVVRVLLGAGFGIRVGVAESGGERV